MFQEEVELWVTARVDGGFEQRHEDVLQHLLEVSQLLLCAVNVTGRRRNRNFRFRQCLTFLKKAHMYLQQPGHLNEPAYIIRVHAVFNGPLSQLIPFVPGAAVDGQP